MSQPPPAVGKSSDSPRAAAVAGVIFSLLCAASLVLVRVAVPADPVEAGAWLSDPDLRRGVHWSLQLIPFAGIAFLWFMAVVRSHVGLLEDRFFSTVFLGSGLLFVAMLFVTTAVARGLMDTFSGDSTAQFNSEVYAVARATSYTLINTFGTKMAAVFMFVTSAISLRTGIAPRPLAFLGYVLGLALLLVITDWAWIALLFPLWVLLVSLYLLIAAPSARPSPADRAGQSGHQASGWGR